MSRRKTPRDERYLAFIRAQDCCLCGKDGPSQAAYVRIRGGGGMGLKPSDYRTVPLCAACHGRQHGLGERTFWDRARRVPEVAIATYLTAYLEDRRGAVKLLEEMVIAQREASA